MACGASAHGEVSDGGCGDDILYRCSRPGCENHATVAFGCQEQGPDWFIPDDENHFTVSMLSRNATKPVPYIGNDARYLSGDRQVRIMPELRAIAFSVHAFARYLCDAGVRDDIVERIVRDAVSLQLPGYRAHVACAWESRILVVTIERTEK